MDFEILGAVSETETIAVGRGIRDLRRLERIHGRGRWRKRKGFATVRIKDTDETFAAEIHWYEATGIRRREFKIKRRLEPKA
jgi:hypothetical protein